MELDGAGERSILAPGFDPGRCSGPTERAHRCLRSSALPWPSKVVPRPVNQMRTFVHEVAGRWPWTGPSPVECAGSRSSSQRASRPSTRNEGCPMSRNAARRAALWRSSREHRRTVRITPRTATPAAIRRRFHSSPYQDGPSTAVRASTRFVPSAMTREQAVARAVLPRRRLARS